MQVIFLDQKHTEPSCPVLNFCTAILLPGLARTPHSVTREQKAEGLSQRSAAGVSCSVLQTQLGWAPRDTSSSTNGHRPCLKAELGKMSIQAKMGYVNILKRWKLHTLLKGILSVSKSYQATSLVFGWSVFSEANGQLPSYMLLESLRLSPALFTCQFLPAGRTVLSKPCGPSLALSVHGSHCSFSRRYWKPESFHLLPLSTCHWSVANSKESALDCLLILSVLPHWPIQAWLPPAWPWPCEVKSHYAFLSFNFSW